MYSVHVSTVQICVRYGMMDAVDATLGVGWKLKWVQVAQAGVPRMQIFQVGRAMVLGLSGLMSDAICQQRKTYFGIIFWKGKRWVSRSIRLLWLGRVTMHSSFVMRTPDVDTIFSC